MMINVLILGSGGREHALAWKIAQSNLLGELYCLPGNPGTSEIAKNIECSINDFPRIKDIVLENNIGLVVVGPEGPLVNGIKDFFKNDSELAPILFIGPDKVGASLEGSKKFAKEFMSRHNIPTAAYNSFIAGEQNKAIDFLNQLKPPYVLKADGLAAGKGVLILDTVEEAVTALEEMFSGKFGAAGDKVVIEEFLSGIEVSVFVLADGQDYMILPLAKDYKRINDGDKGLNTGGMGAVSPVPFADKAFMEKVETRIIKPTVDGINSEGIDYKGFIFIGLMCCNGEPYVIEYNVRMGDPETEAVMTRIESDFLKHLIAAAKGEIASEKIEITSKTAVTSIIVSGGYPDDYVNGFPIIGIDDVQDIHVFHSGTMSSQAGGILTNGGRVLALTSIGEDIASAREHLYNEISKIDFEGMYYRKDIGLDIISHE